MIYERSEYVGIMEEWNNGMMEKWNIGRIGELVYW